MINITLPDNSKKQLPEGSSAMDLALSISEGLARNVLAASVNGATVDASTALKDGDSVTLFTWNNPEGKINLLAFICPLVG